MFRMPDTDQWILARAEAIVQRRPFSTFPRSI